MKTIILIMALISISSVKASDGIYIDSVTYGGSGCKADEAWGILSPDQKVLSVLFDNFIVEAGDIVGTDHHRKNCNLKINVKVPQDKVVIIKKIDYRLYAMIPQRGKMQFKASYNMHVPALNYTSRTFTKQKTNMMAMDDELLIEQPMVTALMKSKCGHDFSLNIDTQLIAQTNNLGEDAYVSLDSMDGGIEYHIETQDCHIRDNRHQGHRRGRGHRRVNPRNPRRPRR